MITRGHLWQFVLGASAVVALAACQSSDRAGAPSPAVRPTEVTASTSPTASASATPTESDEATAWARVPAPARAHTYAGAQAFAEFYVGQINKAWTTPDPELLRPYGLPSCKSCANYVGTATDFEAKAQRYADPPLAVVAGAWLPESKRSVALVSIVWAQKRTQIVAADGTQAEVIPAAKGVSEFEMRWQAAGWRVAAIRLEGMP